MRIKEITTLDDPKQYGITQDPKTGKWIDTKDPTAIAKPATNDTQDNNIIKSFGTGVTSKIRKAPVPADNQLQSKYNIQNT